MCILKKLKMDSFEINKIIAAVLVTVLLVFGIGKISDIIFHVEDPKVQGYKVKVKLASSSSAELDSENQVDIAALLSMGNIEHGKKVFKKCAACHSIKQDGGNKIGPKLWGVMFRPVASITDYKYSKALSGYKKEWSWEEMNGFLIKPSSWIKGNKMGFAGLKKEKDRASVILYLNQNSDSPKTLP
jgi:cytochrome c